MALETCLHCNAKFEPYTRRLVDRLRDDDRIAAKHKQTGATRLGFKVVGQVVSGAFGGIVGGLVGGAVAKAIFGEKIECPSCKNVFTRSPEKKSSTT